MASGIIALGDEDIVIHAAFQGFIQRYRRTHEFLFDLAEAFEAGLQLEVVITRAFSDRGHDGDVVAFGADVVCGGDESDVDIWERENELR